MMTQKIVKMLMKIMKPTMGIYNWKLGLLDGIPPTSDSNTH